MTMLPCPTGIMKKPSKNLMDEELTKIYNWGTAYATRRQNMLFTYQEPEDFGAYCVEEKLRERYKRLEWMFIDYLRKSGGRKGTNGYDQKQALERPASLNALIGDSNTEWIERIDVGSRGSDLEAREKLDDFKRNLRIKNKRHKEMIDMYLDGFNLKEIGERFDLSESRISQIISLYLSPVKTKNIFSKLETLSEGVKKWLSTN